MKKILLIFVACVFGLALPNEQISSLQREISNLDTKISNNIWFVRYLNYSIYQDLNKELEQAKADLSNLNSKDSAKELELTQKISSLNRQLELLKEYKNSPFQPLLTPPKISQTKKIANPIELISGYSAIKHLKEQKSDYSTRLSELNLAYEILLQKENLQKQICSISPCDNAKFNLLKKQVIEFSTAKDIANTTFVVYQKQLDEAISLQSVQNTEEIKRSANLAILIIAIIVFGFLLKLVFRRYAQAKRFYTINKAINILSFLIIIFILLFAYIENVNYLVTILGFASAGLAIAMKDMFMSFLGWCVIVGGGSLHVGDRIRVSYKDNTYVGDIIDISLLRITIYEDITWATYLENRRSGRIIFIPNNYIFTELISNYTHGGMKTVWDGIDILISFDSNHKKAVYIIKNIARKYSKGYTDIAKLQMNKLRDTYRIKNTNVEPRIYTFFEPNGINISVWYQTNSYATLSLRSTISSEIIEAINKEPDIKIAFGKQTLYFEKDKMLNFAQESREI
nr:mechanosensitive ion channel [Campylobacter sp.]